MKSDRTSSPRLRLPSVLLLIALVLLLAVGCGGSSHRSACKIVLRALPTKGRQITAAQMQTAQQILTQRLSKLGVSSPTITAQGGNELVIQLAGVHDPVDVAQTIDITGRLEIFDLEPSLAPPTVTGNQRPAPLPSLYAVLSAAQKEADKGSPQAYYLFQAGTKNHPVLQGPAASLQQLFLSYKGGKQPPHTQVLKVPTQREPVSCAMATGCPGADSSRISKSGRAWYLLKLPPALTGKDLVESGTTADVDPNTGQAIVLLQFTGRGSKAFQRITEAEYNRGRIDAGLAGQLGATDQNTIATYAGHNAIVLDGVLEETPYIDYTDSALSQGIVGNAQITEPSAAAAKRTALILQSGSLPYRFERVQLSNCDR
jgi:preprotein translocase subunit SecD